MPPDEWPEDPGRYASRAAGSADIGAATRRGHRAFLRRPFRELLVATVVAVGTVAGFVALHAVRHPVQTASPAMQTTPLPLQPSAPVIGGDDQAPIEDLVRIRLTDTQLRDIAEKCPDSPIPLDSDCRIVLRQEQVRARIEKCLTPPVGDCWMALTEEQRRDIAEKCSVSPAPLNSDCLSVLMQKQLRDISEKCSVSPAPLNDDCQRLQRLLQQSPRDGECNGQQPCITVWRARSGKVFVDVTGCPSGPKHLCLRLQVPNKMLDQFPGPSSVGATPTSPTVVPSPRPTTTRPPTTRPPLPGPS
jgi:hypothetical protein